MATKLSDLRKALLANGYWPLPGKDKECRMTGWNDWFLAREAERHGSLEAAIDTWDVRLPDYPTTNVRIEKGLLPIDNDVRDPKLAAEVERIVAEVAPDVAANAPLRIRAGTPKCAWFARYEGEPFIEHHSLKYVSAADAAMRAAEVEAKKDEKRPRYTPIENYHHVEIFGGAPDKHGNCSRQFGVFGPHTVENGKVLAEYDWAEGPTLETLALKDLPVITIDQIWAILRGFEEAAERLGWVALPRRVRSAGGSGWVCDIDPDVTEFDTKDAGWVNYAELTRMVEAEGKIYLQATFIPGEVSDSFRCAAMWSDKYKCVMVEDWGGDRHLPIGKRSSWDSKAIGAVFDRAQKLVDNSGADWKVETDELTAGDSDKITSGLRATPYQWIDPDKLPLRDWLYGRLLVRRFITMTVAPGGVGKSSLIAVEALAQTSGRNLLGEKVPRPLNVWLWNLEDPHEETQRKIQAAALRYGISERDISGRLYVDSGRDQSLVVAKMDRNGPTIVQPIVKALVEQIKLRKIDVLVIDPFVSCHELPENDNTAQDMVVKEWGKVAELGGCAVHLVDHTRKTAPGVEVSTESSRGAKAKTDAARIVRVVNRMSEAESIAAQIDNPWQYFRTFNDKANLAPPVDASDWFQLESVNLGNGSELEMGIGAGSITGDSVGVVTRWVWPTIADAANGENFKAMVEVMAVGGWRKDPRSPDWVGNAVAKALNLDPILPRDRKKINAVLAVWMRAGLLKEVEQLDDKRKLRTYIEIAGGV